MIFFNAEGAEVTERKYKFVQFASKKLMSSVVRATRPQRLARGRDVRATLLVDF